MKVLFFSCASSIQGHGVSRVSPSPLVTVLPVKERWNCHPGILQPLVSSCGITAPLPKRGVPQSPAVYQLTRQKYDSSFSKVLLGIIDWPWHSTRHAASHQWKHAQTHSYFLPVALNANSHDLHFREKTRGIPSGFHQPEIRRRCWAVSWREEVKYSF